MTMRRQQQLLPSSRAAAKPSKPSHTFDTLTWIILLFFSCFISFYWGIHVAFAISPPQNCNSNIDSNSLTSHASIATDCKEKCLNAVIGGQGELANLLDGKLDSILAEKIAKGIEAACPGGQGGTTKGSSPSKSSKRFENSLSSFANGLVSVNKKDLFHTFDFGVPMDPGAERMDALMLYDSLSALPFKVAQEAEYGGRIPHTSASSATENCDVMNVMFLKNPNKRVRQCLALVPQYHSNHIQKWMRLVGSGPHGKVDSTAPLRVTGRMTKSDGYDELLYPKKNNLEMHREILLNYLTNIHEIETELGAILQRIAIDNTVVVSTVNKGQSELLMNFVCSSRARGFDLKNFIVFPTDLFSKELAEGLGIATFYAEKLMHAIPTQEALRYGDPTFGLIMMAKVICVQLVNELGYDMLFQDVDVIWYKNPLSYFHDEKHADFDVYFQDDGNRQERYAPYSANSGFYYIRNNDRSKLFFRTMLYSGDLIFACRSHQQILITLLAESNSLTGMKVKVFNKEEDDFPGGFHYHMRIGSYMKEFVAGHIDPYIFHMSWTLNKDDKLKFMRQMGVWYVNDDCIGKSVEGDAVSACCSAEPLITCYYKDKPSIKSCSDSPPKDKNGQSFW